MSNQAPAIAGSAAGAAGGLGGPQGNPFGNQRNPMLRGLFGAILFLLLALPSWATTTITGHIADLGTISQSGNTFVRFTLRGCGGGQPRVLLSALIAPTQGAAWYKDFAANTAGNVSGTIYSTRDATSLLGGDIDCNGSKVAVWYGMTIWQGGKSGPEIPVHALNGATLDVSSVTPITVNPVVVAPSGDSTYCRLDAGTGFCPQPSTTPGNWIIKGPNPWVDVLAFGAACDGVTDDSVALQNAGNFAISAGGVLKLPPQTCAYSTGLLFTQAIQIMGAAEQGDGGGPPVSSLKYTGTGTALKINNGTNFIYGVHLRSFIINGTTVSNQGVGLNCAYCNQPVIENVFVTSTSAPGFAIAADFSNSAGLISNNLLVGNGGVAVKLVGATNVNIGTCQLFQNTIAFLMGGNNQGIFVHDCPNIERQDYLVDWDDAFPSAAVTFGDNIHFERDYVIFDGGAATYPHQQVLHVSNTSTNQLTLRNLIFSDNTLFCATGFCGSTYAFNLAISGTTSAASAITLTVERNWLFGFSAGGVTSNNLAATVSWINNQNLNSFGFPVATDTNGTAYYCVTKYVGGTNNTCAIATPSVTATTLTASGAVTGASFNPSGDSLTLPGVPRMFMTAFVATVTAATQAWLAVPSVGRSITITRIGLNAVTAPAGCSTSPQFGILGSAATLALPNGSFSVDSGAISVSSTGGGVFIGVTNVDAGCGTQPANVGISIDYIMQ